MNKTFNRIMGTLIGIINVVIGACGGIVAVECMKHNKLSQNKSHATAISIILPLTIVSALLYVYKNKSIIFDSLIFLIPGMLGALIGAAILPKIPSYILKKAFSIFIIYAGLRMILK